MKNKAQAAAEFLLTYGWVVVIVIFAIGIIAYFGIVNADKLVPSKCIISSVFYCEDYKISPNTTFLAIRNSNGWDINVTQITVGNCSWKPNKLLANGDMTTFNSGEICNNGILKKIFKADIIIDYYNIQTGIPRSQDGTIVSKIIG